MTSGTASSSNSNNGGPQPAPPGKKKRVVIVGGGPAGAAIATGLRHIQAKNQDNNDHLDVQVFEAYSHPNKIATNSPKAYVIAMGGRGQGGIRDATQIKDLTQIPGAVLSTQMVRHPANKVRDHSTHPSLVVSRQALTAHLLDAAETAGAHVHFNQRLLRVDFVQRVAYFIDTGGMGIDNIQEVPYDLLIGADGSNSSLRKLMDEKLPSFQVEREEVDSMEYQVAVLPGQVFSDLPATAVHAWNNKEYNAICLAFPTAGNTLFALVFPEGKLEEFQKEHLQNQHGYDKALKALLPDLDDKSRAAMIEQLAQGEPANGGLCVWCNSLGSPKDGVVLVGDSGHGMWPSLGQGANCAMESAAIFVQTVKDLQQQQQQSNSATGDSDVNSWSAAIAEEFNTRRYKDAIAAVDLTYGGIGARKSRGRGNAPLSYKLQMMGIMILNKFSFGIVPKPALLRLMMGETMPYSTARNYNFYYEKVICIGALVVGMCGGGALYRYRTTSDGGYDAVFDSTEL